MQTCKTNLPASTGVRSLSAHADFFVVRTPARPFAEFAELAEGMLAPRSVGGDDAVLDEAIVRDRALLAARLAEHLRDPVLREALCVASPALAAELNAWEAGRLAVREAERVTESVAKYFARATTRATPFGLFASLSTGEITSSDSAIRLCTTDEWVRRTRADSLVVNAARDALLADPATWPRVPVRPNETIHRVGDRFHLIERLINPAKGSSFALSVVDVTPHLERVLHEARAGCSPREIADRLADGDVPATAWLDFLRRLIDEHVLISEADPVITTPDPLVEMIRVASAAGSPLEAELRAVQRAVESLDASPAGANADSTYAALAARMSESFGYGAKYTAVQVDSVRRTEKACLDRRVAAAFLDGAALLGHVTLARDWLKPFRDAFRERYEEAAVPFLEVLDEEVGIGCPDPLRGVTEIAATARDRLTELVFRATRDGSRSVELTDVDLAALANPAVPGMPDCFAVEGTVVAASEAHVSRGEFQVIVDMVTGPSGATLLGRFCHCDATLLGRVRQHVADEAAMQPDVVFADIVHDPGHRAANVVVRAPLRRYAIPMLSRAHPDQVSIPLDDLVIRVVGNDVILWSKSLERRVVPRLDTAHNFVAKGALIPYTFLCLLQLNDGTPPRSWNWSHLEGAPFLPRVVRGQVILRRAEWSLGTDDLPLDDTTPARLYRSVQHWREVRGVPRRVRLEEGDQSILIDFDMIASVDALVRCVRKEGRRRLVEVLPDDDGVWVTGRGGRYLNEVIIPFRRPETSARRAAPMTANGTARRKYAPLSEWVYAKVYLGRGMMERFLKTAVTPLVAALESSGVVDRWFFVRYADPEPHLRLRLHHANPEGRERVMEALEPALATALDSSVAWRVQYDTYHREVERYGGFSAIDDAERLFTEDSRAALALLHEYDGGWVDVRSFAAVRSVVQLAAECGLSPAESCALFERIRGSADADVRRIRSERHRQVRGRLDDALADVPVSEDLAPLRQILASRAVRTRDITPRWLAACASTPVTDALHSLMHMSVNRLGIPRADEEHTYDLAARALRSRMARARGDVPGSASQA